jgi:hypothetical protein
MTVVTELKFIGKKEGMKNAISWDVAYSLVALLFFPRLA